MWKLGSDTIEHPNSWPDLCHEFDRVAFVYTFNMGEGDPFNPDAARRVAKFMASGENPEGYYVNSGKLKEVIRATPDVDDDFKEEILEILEARVVKGMPHADSFKVGLTFGQLSNELGDDPEKLRKLYKINKEVSDLNKLPFVSIKGKPAH